MHLRFLLSFILTLLFSFTLQLNAESESECPYCGGKGKAKKGKKVSKTAMIQKNLETQAKPTRPRNPIAGKDKEACDEVCHA